MHDEVLRERACRWCGGTFHICAHCDRGHAYCGKGCRDAGYARNRRGARERFEQSLGEEEARLDHRDRQREHRARAQLCERVTDQGSPPPADEGKVEPEEPSHADRSEASERWCIVCGRTSVLTVWHPSRSTRRGRRGPP